MFRRRPNMVSRLSFVALSFATAQMVLAASPQAAAAPQAATPQVMPPHNGFREASRSPQAPALPPPKPVNIVTPEMRGDIFMARRMYRDAVDAYQEGPKTAVLLNKTGIAYHQLLEFSMADKYYRLAIRTNPDYAEAINNLGTIFYARKSFRRAVNEYKKA